MISTRGWFPFECHGAGTNLSAKKTGFYFFFFPPFNGRCTFFLFYVEVVGKPQIHWICFNKQCVCSFQPDGCRVAEPKPGDPQECHGGKPGTNETPSLGKAGARRFLPSRCPRADAAAAGDSRGQASVFPAGSPPAPYLPAAFPDGLTCRKIQRQGSCCKRNAKGRAPGAAARLPGLGACAGMDLGTEIWTTTSVGEGTIHGHTHPSQPSSSLSLQGCSKEMGFGDPTAVWGFASLVTVWCHITRCHQALLAGHRWQGHVQRGLR